MKKVLLLFLFLLAITSVWASPTVVTSPKTNSQFFIENKGQWNKDALYLARLNGLNYWITKTGVVSDYIRIEDTANYEDPRTIEDPDLPQKRKIYGHVIKTTLVDLNTNFAVRPDGIKEGYFNYIIDNDPSKWQTYVHLYSSVKLENVYNGIDVVYFYTPENQIRYDYYVAPNADLSQIKMKFEGQDGLELAPNGDLIFKTSLGDIAHGKLYAYQEVNGTQQQISCNFKIIDNNVVTFQVSNYDKNLPIIIDPTVNYVTYFGKTGTDYSYTTGIDPSGNAIIAGYTYSADLPVTTGAYQTSRPYSYCGYVTKMNANGNGLVFCTYLGASASYNYIYGCGSDQYGNTYVSGYTAASNFPVTSGAFQTTMSTSPDIFVTKLNTTGTGLIYSTFLGGNNSDYVYGMYVDKDGYAYMTGYTYSTNFPVSSGAYKTSPPYSGSANVYVTKLNPTGTALAMSSYLGGTSSTSYGYAISADPDGNPYVTGYTYATNFPTTSGAYKTTTTYTPANFVTKFNASGTSLLYSTFIPASNSTFAYGICVNSNGEAAITGYTYATDFPITAGALQTTISTTPDAFVLKLNSTGSGLVFSTYLGGTSTDYGRGIATDATGNIYVAGYDYSTNFPGITPDGYQKVLSTTPDAFFTALSPTGSLLYGTFIGGTSSDLAYYYGCVAANSLNQVAVGGYTSSTNFPVTAGAYQTTASTTPDAWVAKFQFDPPCKITTTGAMPYQFCAGDALTVTFKSEGVYKSGNIYSVQLSDENGSFASPKVIGTLQSSVVGNGTINCTLPSAMMPKSGYRVRVISSNPYTVGTDNGVNLEVMTPPTLFKLIGDGGYCENDKFGAEVKLESSEKYTMYQLYRDGIRVGASIAGTGFPISFGTFKTTGAYTVQGTSPFGCKTTMDGSINVRQIPTPVAYSVTGGGQFYNQSGPGTYCEGSEGVAIGLSHGDMGVKYQLKRNGQDVDVPIPGVGGDISFGYHTEEGVYTIEATSILGGCANIMNGSVTVKMLPAPKAYDVISDGVFCEGDLKGSEIKLSNSDIGCNYQLFFNGVAIGKPINGTGSSISFGNFKQSGDYNVVATNLSTGCTSNMNGTITFKTIPQPKTFNLIGSEKYCEDVDGTDLTLDGSETNIIYTLYFNNQPASQGILGNGSPIDFGKFKDAGTYTCQAASIDGHCTILMNGSINVTPVALPDVTIQGNATPKMLSAEIYSVTNPKEGEIYLWNVKNGTIDGANNKATVSINWLDKKKGEVSVIRTNKYNCTNQGKIDINLLNDIVVDFDAKQKAGDAPFLVQFENKTTGIVSYYNWDFGDGLYSPSENPGHTYKTPGTYSVTLTVSHEGDTKKQSKSDFIKVFPANSVNENIISNDANTYGFSLIEPNPANNHISFDYFVKSNQTIEIAVFDSKGTKVLVAYKGLALIGNNSLTIDISKLSSGSYYLEMIGNEGIINQHFTIVR
jgi:PKD repeat protein